MPDVLEILDPSTGKVYDSVRCTSLAALDAAIGRAAKAQRAWGHASPHRRAELLFTLSQLVAANSEELATLESRNVGKPIKVARGEVALAAEVLRFYGGAVDKFGGRTIPVEDGIDMTFPEPIGPVGVIVPWNYPLAIATWKLAPALAAGNTVIVKPAEQTPATLLRLLALAQDAGFEEDVFQVVIGAGETIGRGLVADPRIRKVSFTGSTAVGREVATSAAAQLKHVTLELGGKSANIVFADADLDAAASAAPGAVFGNTGQDCCSRSRILVERAVFSEFVERFVEETERLVVGDPALEKTDLGPLISAEHRERVASFLQEGALCGGVVPDQPGFWFPPTIYAPVGPRERIAVDEIFGPIAAVIPFDGEEEALAIANGTEYGLSGSVWTENGGRAVRVAQRLEVGTVSINSNSSVRVATPFGGVKSSGLGRELGMEALTWATETKNVFFSTRVG